MKFGSWDPGWWAGPVAFMLISCFHFTNIDDPVLVFDEVTTVQTLSFMSSGTFFFDDQPPLGKLVLFTVGRLFHSELTANLSLIGSFVPDQYPIAQMRFVSLVFTVALPCVVWQLLHAVGLPVIARLAVCVGLLFDNALLTHFRLAGLESLWILLVVIGLLCASSAKTGHGKSISYIWRWIIVAVCLAVAINLKYRTVFTSLVILANLAYDHWTMLDNPGKTMKSILSSAFATGGLFLGLPTAVYLGSFYCYFERLTQPGPQNVLLSPAFQRSFQTDAQLLNQSGLITCGSHVTLRNFHQSPPCWLHSHPHLYPIKYKDGRGSSHQQQVTCYEHKDVNNWWIVESLEGNRECQNDTDAFLQHGSVVELSHGMSGAKLNSHDVGAPVTAHNQEASGFVDHRVNMTAHTRWIVGAIDLPEGAPVDHISPLKILHESTQHFLTLTGSRLDEWAFRQLEVAGAKRAGGEQSWWLVEEHKAPKQSSAKNVPKHFARFPSTKLSFWRKFREIHTKMLDGRSLPQPDGHLFSCGPADWLMLDCTVPYWSDFDSQKQIHLVGNPVVWIGSFVLATSGIVYVSILLTLKQGGWGMPDGEYAQVVLAVRYLVPAWLANLVPFWFTGQTLFLHHCLAGLVCQILLAGMVLSLVEMRLRSLWAPLRIAHTVAVSLWMTAMVAAFVWLFPLCCGQSSQRPQDIIRKFVWKDSWDTLVLRSV